MRKSVFVVIPNYNGSDRLREAAESVLNQSYRELHLLIVDNGSVDNSRKIIEELSAKDPRVEGIYRDKNYGYTGGVNPGMERAIAAGAAYVAPFNNDAVADKQWLETLVAFLDHHKEYGIATCSLLNKDGSRYDSTGDIYTSWGLPYPRGRDEEVRGQYDDNPVVFGASGGASLYRVKMLAAIGLFDQDFFAYCEDIDLSFRAQLAGWKVRFVPASRVYHEQGVTSSKLKNHFTTRQTLKNYPWVVVKDVPARLLPRILPRFLLAYTLLFWRAVFDRRGRAAMAGVSMALWLLPKKLWQRRQIQRTKTVSTQYIWNTLTHDLPPNAHKLRTLRHKWRFLRKRAT